MIKAETGLWRRATVEEEDAMKIAHREGLLRVHLMKEQALAEIARLEADEFLPKWTLIGGLSR